jgi:YggT family protein
VEKVIVSLIDLIYTVVLALIMLRMIFSWTMPYGPKNDFAKLVYSITESMLKPFRIIIPLGNMGGIDLAPIILLVLIGIVRRVVIFLI